MKNDDLLNALFRTIPDLIIFKDGAGRWMFASDFALNLLGLDGVPYAHKTSSELAKVTKKHHYRDILLSRERDEENAWHSRKMTRSEIGFPKIGGYSITLDVLNYPLYNEDGSRKALVVIGRDITERKLAEEQVAKLAYYDPLTDLPNRFRFEMELEKNIVISKTLEQRFVVMVIDIDRFKYINNSLGPKIGDQLIVEISKRLKLFTPTDSFLARLYGNKFALIIPDLFLEQSADEAATTIIDCFKNPFIVDQYELFLTCTIGLCRYPFAGEDVQTLMKNVETALSLAKENGKNCFMNFDAKMDVASYKLFNLENSLNKAMPSGQFEIYYQPKIEVCSNRIIGAEALIRWNHPEWGVTSPKEFIPLAEETGLIIPIGNWVIQTVCAQNKAWERAGLPIVPISVNVSIKQFMHKDFIGNIKRCLRENDLDPKYLEIEITETSLIENETFATEVIDQLNECGIKVALDDFGTGYSALSYLKQFNVSAIKIDRSFIKEIGINEKVSIIVEGLIQMANGLNIVVIAEGVETKEQMQFLKKHNCNQVQGYLFSKPVIAEKFTVLLKRQQLDQSFSDDQDFKLENRRKFYRVQLVYPLLADMTIVKFMGKELHLGTTEILIWDIGLGGLSFAVNVKMGVHSDIILRVNVVILGKRMDFVGKIVWTKEAEEDIHIYGMEFLIDEYERQQVAKVLNRFSVKLKEYPILPGCRFVTTSSNDYLKSSKE